MLDTTKTSTLWRVATRCDSPDTEWQHSVSLQAKTGWTASDTPLAAPRLSFNKTQAPIQWLRECLTWVANILQQPLWSRSRNTSCEGAFPTSGCETLQTASLAYAIILTYIINALGGHFTQSELWPVCYRIRLHISDTHTHQCYEKPDERLLKRDVLFFSGQSSGKKDVLKSFKIIAPFGAD